jgi:Gamma-glutamyl cyclotransferase, AIG2-like
VNDATEPGLLFVYGSLVDRARREQIIGRPLPTQPATLPDYERGRARYFFIRKRPGVSTPGLLIFALTRIDFDVLDHYEEIPRLYTRDKMEVLDAAGNRISTWIYLPTALTLSGGE